MENRILVAKLLVAFTLIVVVVTLTSCTSQVNEGFHGDHAPGASSDKDYNPNNEFIAVRVTELEELVEEQQAVIVRITSFMVDLSNDYVLLERRVEALVDDNETP